LNIAEVVLPPLRDRREDIPYLTAVFVRQCAERFGKTLTGLTPAAERMLIDARWEGNVRQLRNVLERGCMLANGEFITDVDLEGVDQPVSVPPPVVAQRVDLPAPLMEIEREHIVRTLEQVRGNKAVAARLLGISRRAFYRQLERHGLHHRVPMGSARRLGPPLEQAS
jgi:DNA-binding NtrC family response regulator